MSSIAVAIISYNTRELLRDCLDSVPGNAGIHSIIVVDNGSSDGTLEMLRRDYPGVRLGVNAVNAGYGAAANLALAQCDADYVLLLNSDTRLALDTVVQLRAFLDARPEVAVVGPRLLNPDGTLQPSCFHFPTPLEVFLDVAHARQLVRHIPLLRDRYLRTWPHTQPLEVAWLSGAALAIRRRAFDAVGGFDPTFLFYYEETDLCYRLWQAGWKIAFAPVTEVVHIGGASSSSGTDSRTANSRPHRVRPAQLTVQLYAGLAHFYQRHYTPVARAVLAVLLEAMALLRYGRDAWRLWRSRDRDERAALQTNLQAWRLLLRGRWNQQGGLASTPVTMSSVTSPSHQP